MASLTGGVGSANAGDVGGPASDVNRPERRRQILADAENVSKGLLAAAIDTPVIADTKVQPSGLDPLTAPIREDEAPILEATAKANPPEPVDKTVQPSGLADSLTAPMRAIPNPPKQEDAVVQPSGLADLLEANDPPDHSGSAYGDPLEVVEDVVTEGKCETVTCEETHGPKTKTHKAKKSRMPPAAKPVKVKKVKLHDYRERGKITDQKIEPKTATIEKNVLGGPHQVPDMLPPSPSSVGDPQVLNPGQTLDPNQTPPSK